MELPGAAGWQCAGCDHALTLPPAVTAAELPACVVCGNPELYKKKDFPHWLGLAILTVACLSFLALMGLYHQWLAWVILIGSAIFDGLLYLWVGDVIVCYRCGAHYRRITPGPRHQPFDLGIAERYRQERLRREQLQAENKSPR
jgi:hypothetical protein